MVIIGVGERYRSPFDRQAAIKKIEEQISELSDASLKELEAKIEEYLINK